MDKHRIKFWGVRGSFPTPDRDKIEVGGHSSCVEVRTADNELIVFDMGTGFIPLGSALLKEEHPPKSAHVFISHFHWDHILGYLVLPPSFLTGLPAIYTVRQISCPLKRFLSISIIILSGQ